MKKLLIALALGGGFLYYQGKSKLAQIKHILKNSDVFLRDIRNVRFDLSAIRFDVDLDLKNNSNFPLSINSYGAVTLKKLLYYNLNGDFLGESMVNRKRIDIDAGGLLSIDGLATAIPIKNIGGALNTTLTLLQSPDSLKIKVEIETPAGTFIV